jgi:hypothetical protein
VSGIIHKKEKAKMNVRMLRHVRQMWNVDHVSQETNRANQRKWVRSVRLLGDKWLLAQHIERKTHA